MYTSKYWNSSKFNRQGYSLREWCYLDNSTDRKTVTGVVTDNVGPVIGANVLVKGTTNGVITDFDGKFTLSNVPEGAILQISFIGYQTKEIKVAGKTEFYCSIKRRFRNTGRSCSSWLWFTEKSKPDRFRGSNWLKSAGISPYHKYHKCFTRNNS